MTNEEAIETLKNHKPYDLLNAYKVGEALDMAIKALEQEPCEDAISRDAAIDLIADFELSMDEVVRGVHALPSVTSQPKTGHWIKKGNTLKCPLCGAKGADIKDDYCFNYCPNCGAKMVKPQESEE